MCGISQINYKQSALPPLFVEAWIYSSALSVVEQCTTWSTDFKFEASKSTPAGKGELLDVARSQVNLLYFVGVLYLFTISIV